MPITLSILKSQSGPFISMSTLPDSYGENDQIYPVIYLLDGVLILSDDRANYLLVRFNEPLPEAIIVGISYSGLGSKQGNYRGTDYTASSPERETFWRR